MLKYLPVCFVMAIAVFISVPASAAEKQPRENLRFAQAATAEISFWESVRNATDASELQAYLSAYPKGQFAPLARIRLKKLKSGTTLKSTAVSETSFEPREKEITATLLAYSNDKNKGWLGVWFFDLKKSLVVAFKLTASKGVVIGRVAKNTAAEKAGIVRGNIILSIDGTSTPDGKTLARLVAAHAPGDKVVFKVLQLAKTPDALARLVIQKLEDRDDKDLRGFLLKLGGTETAKWYRKAAENGDVEAMYRLGRLYAGGANIPRDKQKELDWTRKAAQGGHVKAMSQLGFMLRFAFNKTYLDIKDTGIEAAKWYRKAAEKGDVSAMSHLGEMYHSGVYGFKKDTAKALVWYRKAVDKGNVSAMHGLGIMYDKGTGVAKAPGTAARYFIRAIKAAGNLLRDQYIKDVLKWSTNSRRAIQQSLRTAGLYTGPVDGKLGPATLRALEEMAFDPAKIQRQLADLGFDPGPIDGKVDSKTRNAIKAFARKNSLTPDGRITQFLVDALKTASNKQQKKAGATAGSATDNGDDLKGLDSLD